MGTILANHKVHFQYGTTNIEILKNQETLVVAKPTITCVIENDKEVQIANESVRLYHEDKDHKVTGRKFAFRKAVNTLNNKELRTALWADYKNKMRLPALITN